MLPVPGIRLSALPLRLIRSACFAVCMLSMLGASMLAAQTATTLAITSGGKAVSTVLPGAAVTLTATVQNAGNPVTAGQVNFCNATATNCAGINLVGSAQLSASGTAWMISRPAPGAHSYKAIFVGTTAAQSSASAAGSLSVSGPLPAVATSTAISESGVWGAYTLGATVTSIGGTAAPGGTLSFVDGGASGSSLATAQLKTATSGYTWPATSAALGSSNYNSQSPIAADINGDGLMDFVQVQTSGFTTTVHVFLAKGDGTFSEVSNTGLSLTNVLSLVVGDFNGDGRPDLALTYSPTYYGNTFFAVALGQGDGTFQLSATSVAFADSLSTAAVGDFNGDGNLDIAYANGNYTNGFGVQILEGRGDGTFSSVSTSLNSSDQITILAAGDVNGDGISDLAAGARYDSNIDVILGSATNTFTATSITTDYWVMALRLADVNGDGKADLLSGDNGGFHIALGHGDGTFAASTRIVLNSFSTRDIAVADFNQDGNADIVLQNANYYSGPVVLYGNGDGTFVANPMITTSGFNMSQLVLGDFNGDGRIDFASADPQNQKIYIYLTQPIYTSTASATVALPSSGIHAVTANYAGDAANLTSTSAALSLWGVPPATATTLNVTAGGSAASTVAAGTMLTMTATVTSAGAPVKSGQVNFCNSATLCTDLHLIGTAPLNTSGVATLKYVLGSGAQTIFAVYTPSGSGQRSVSAGSAITVQAAAPTYTDSASLAISNASSGDYELTAQVTGFGTGAAPTGTVNFLDTSYSNTQVATGTLGTAISGVGWPATTLAAVPGPILSQATGDFNADGYADLAVISNNNGTMALTIFLGKGDGTFTNLAPRSVGQYNYTFSSLLAGDVNQDGATDLLMLFNNYSSQSSVATWLSNGDGTFAAPVTSTVYQQPPTGGDYITGSMALADFNGDGKPDLVVVGDYVNSGGLIVLQGNGDGTFTAKSAPVDPLLAISSVVTGDVNGDGIVDLVANTGSSINTYLGHGDGTFAAAIQTANSSYINETLALADFNADGKLDVAINGQAWLGQGDGTFKLAPGSASTISVNRSYVGDINHDGILDMLTSDSGGVLVYQQGVGDGTFVQSNPIMDPSLPGSYGMQFVGADFNGDGVPDLALIYSNGYTPYLLLTEPTQTASVVVSHVAPIGTNNHNVVARYTGDTHYAAAQSAPVTLQPAVAPVSFSLAAGSYTSAQTLTLTDATPDATIYYQLQGAQNTSNYVAYTAPIALNYGGAVQVMAYASANGYNTPSAIKSALYTMNLPAAAAPSFTPASGSYAAAQQITIASTITGAQIYYTTDGSTPTQNSTLYTAPFTASASTVIAAVIYAPGYSPSPIALANYYIGGTRTSYIYTIAGNRSMGFDGDGGLATSATLNGPTSTAMDAAGNLYISDYENQVVRRVDAKTGIISTVAGNGQRGYSGDGAAATSATLSFPRAVVADAAGNLYIADGGNSVIRRVDNATGIITTIAGNGKSGTATSGVATQTAMMPIYGMALDTHGNLFLAAAAYVFKLDLAGGSFTTVAGNGSWNYTGDGLPALNNGLTTAVAVAVDASGNLYIDDYWRNAIRRVDAQTSLMTTVAGNGSMGFSGDGGPAKQASLYMPQGIAVDAAGNLYIADTSNGAVREVTVADGLIHTLAGAPSHYCQGIAGDGSPANAASLCGPMNVTTDAAGNLYVTEFDANRIRLITAPMASPTQTTAAPVLSLSSGTYATPQTVTASSTTPGAAIYIDMNASGHNASTLNGGYQGPVHVDGSITVSAVAVAPGYMPSAPTTATYTISATPSAVLTTVAGNGTHGMPTAGAATASAFTDPNSLTVDAAGNLYILDILSNTIVKVDAKGQQSIAYQVSTYQSAGTLTSIVADNAGNLYYSDVQHGSVYKVNLATGKSVLYAGQAYCNTLSGDGGPASAACLGSPINLTMDSAGNLYITTQGPGMVRKVNATTGIISTVAGISSNGAYGGDGGPATSAILTRPVATVVDAAGNLYIADAGNASIRFVNAATGIISTLAGTGSLGIARTSAPALSSEISPAALLLDNLGALYIANAQTNVRRMPTGGGSLTTIAGNGYSGYIGENLVATVVGLGQPSAMAMDPSGNLYIADSGLNRIFKVTFAATAAPSPSLPAGTYNTAQSVALSTGTPGALIYYTTDGSTPTQSSTPYTAPINITATTTIKAIAFASGYSASPVATLQYAIVPLNPTPTLGSIAPGFVSAGSAAFTLTVHGTGFIAASTVNWGSQALVTTWVSSTQLTAQVPASLVASSGQANITVSSPTPGGGNSTAMAFEIDSVSASSTSPVFASATATVQAGSSASYTVTLPSSATAITATCLNLPTGASCNYTNGALTITTGNSTPKGTYQVTVVFTETLPGAAAGLLLPFLPLLLRRRRAAGWFVFALLLGVFALTGCGGGGGNGGGSTPQPTSHTVQSSGTVQLTIQ